MSSHLMADLYAQHPWLPTAYRDEPTKDRSTYQPMHTTKMPKDLATANHPISTVYDTCSDQSSAENHIFNSKSNHSTTFSAHAIESRPSHVSLGNDSIYMAYHLDPPAAVRQPLKKRTQSLRQDHGHREVTDEKSSNIPSILRRRKSETQERSKLPLQSIKPKPFNDTTKIPTTAPILRRHASLRNFTPAFSETSSYNTSTLMASPMLPTLGNSIADASTCLSPRTTSMQQYTSALPLNSNFRHDASQTYVPGGRSDNRSKYDHRSTVRSVDISTQTDDPTIWRMPRSKSLRETAYLDLNIENSFKDQDVAGDPLSCHGNTRSRSRAFKSPPPPVSNDLDEPPSVPEMNMQQRMLKASLCHALPSIPAARCDNTDETSTTARSQATVRELDVVNNMKRKLSLTKQRLKEAEKALAAADSKLSADLGVPTDRRSLPAAFAARKKSISSLRITSQGTFPEPSETKVKNRITPTRTGIADYSGYSRTTMDGSRRRSVVYSPPPSRSSTGSRHGFKEKHESYPSLEDDIEDSAIPPVPPVPKKHSMKASIKSECLDVHASLLIGATPKTRNETVPLIPQPRTSSIPKPSTKASTANTSLFINPTSNSSRSTVKPATTSDSNSERITSSQKTFDTTGVVGLTSSSYPVPEDESFISGSEETKSTNANAKAKNRRRGKTLPGSLATPPAIPSAPLPPMKVEPIKLNMPATKPLHKSSSLRGIASTPTRIPMPTPKMTVSRSTPRTSYKTTSESLTDGKSSNEKDTLRRVKSRTRGHADIPQRGSSLKRPSSFKSNTKSTAASVERNPSWKSKTSKAIDAPKRKQSLTGTEPLEKPDTMPMITLRPSVSERTKPRVAVTTTTIKRSHSGRAAANGESRLQRTSSHRKPTLAVSQTESTEHHRLHGDRDSLQVKQGHMNASSEKLQPHGSLKSSIEDRPGRLSGGELGARLPKSPETALKYYAQYLSPFEQSEIRQYPEIYFIGPHAQKQQATLDDPTNNYGYDDKNGDYLITMQDHLAYRYEILDILGRGSFGQVMKCFDHRTGSIVALKMIRNNKRFHAQAVTEVKLLKRLISWDPEDKYHTIRMLDYFHFRNHLCIAFECLSINLYEFIKSNNYQGFSLSLIKRFTIQLLRTLCLLQKHGVIHCDLKPENILLKQPAKTVIKVIDFGSSCLESQKVYTYIQSRFYRAPEIILGMDYTIAIDMWSLGCILAELYTGVPLFPGENEQQQLACILEILGLPKHYLIEKSSRRHVFFDGFDHPRLIADSKGRKRRPGSKTLSDALRCNNSLFVNFIEQCLDWDPETRMRPNEALYHEWLCESA